MAVVVHRHARAIYTYPNGVRLELARGARLEGELAVWLLRTWPERFAVVEALLTGEAPAEALLAK